MNSWGDSSVEYPQNIWFDGGWIILKLIMQQSSEV